MSGIVTCSRDKLSLYLGGAIHFHAHQRFRRDTSTPSNGSLAAFGRQRFEAVSFNPWIVQQQSSISSRQTLEERNAGAACEDGCAMEYDWTLKIGLGNQGHLTDDFLTTHSAEMLCNPYASADPGTSSRTPSQDLRLES